MLARIDMIVAAREHGDRAGGEACAMGGGVDAAGEAGDDGEVRGAEIARQPLGETQPRGRGIARADDRDRRQMQHGGLAAHGKKRRGVVDHLQPARIIGLPKRHEGDAEGFRRLELPLGVLAGMDAGGAAAAGEIRQRRQRGACAAVVVDQRAEGARANIVAADKAKPIEPLLLAQPHAVAAFAHGMIRFGWRIRLGVLYLRTTGNMARCAIERAAITA